MDVLLGKVTSQAMNYAIRSGITITATYAFKQCGRLLKETPRSQQREELMQLQLRLESKIRIISPSIDMIELISARGNTTLESAVSLTKEIRYDIQRLGTRLSEAANEEELSHRHSARAKPREQTERDLRSIISSIKLLLSRIEDAVPLINLAITTSGVNLSTKLSGTISPSRLLQASTFLTAADSKFISRAGGRVQVGPTWTLSLYMLFAGHAWRPVDEAGVRETTWKEVGHTMRVKLVRVPLGELYDLPGEKSIPNGSANDFIPSDAAATEFAYQLLLIEDLDDDRVHTFDEGEPQPGSFDDVATAGIRDVIPIHEISKIFYADTGKILNIGGDSETNSPVLLLRRDVHAEPPRRMMHRSQISQENYDDYDESEVQVNGGSDVEQSEVDAQLHRESAPSTPLKTNRPNHNYDANARWRLPADLDPEWIAFEVYTEETDIESDPEEQDNTANASRPTSHREDSLGPDFTSALSKLNLKSPHNSPIGHKSNQLIPSQTPTIPPTRHHLPPIKSSLSLLEMLLKLTALQSFRQESHLSISDELLNFFLEDAATAGAGEDKEVRKRVRMEAARRVGFDPYDESPVKRRGEGYLERAKGGASPRAAVVGYEAEGLEGELEVGGVDGFDEGLDDDVGVTPNLVLQSIEHPPHLSPTNGGTPGPPLRAPYLQHTPSPVRSSPPISTPSGLPLPLSSFPSIPNSPPYRRNPPYRNPVPSKPRGKGTHFAQVGSRDMLATL